MAGLGPEDLDVAPSSRPAAPAEPSTKATASHGADESARSSTARMSSSPLVAVGIQSSSPSRSLADPSPPPEPTAGFVGARPSPHMDHDPTLNMSSLAAGLPALPAPQPTPQMYSPHQQTFPMPHPMLHPGQTGLSAHAPPTWNPHMGPPYHPQYPQGPPAGVAPGAHGFAPRFPVSGVPSPAPGTTPLSYSDQAWHTSPHVAQMQPVYYHPPIVMPSGQPPYQGRAGPRYPGPHPRRTGQPQHQHSPRPPEGGAGRGISPPAAFRAEGAGAAYGTRATAPHLRPANTPSATRRGSGESVSPTHSGMPRGPPRKPRQSGHALWVGNLPPGTNVVELKDHFAREATQDIESVFLISKSNCAFVNYKTESSCAAAMTRFHDSRFRGVRLVCRLRRSAVATASGGTTSPTVNPAPETDEVADPETRSAPAALLREEASQGRAGVPANADLGPTSTATVEKDKFFVVKSLTVEDLELSVRNGIWATQSHNEAALNKAFETADNVYLIFSANKSGEYFGYARMVSAIDEASAATIEWVPHATPLSESDLPRAIPTPATATAPRGRIIDDSARGTIFWEAELDPERDEEGASEDSSSEESDHGDAVDAEVGEDTAKGKGKGRRRDVDPAPDPEAEAEGPAEGRAWGKPFRVEWISTSRLPFYRTRGLRNALNANREVKIARDGTELEATVGRRLLQMFHRLPSPQSAPMYGTPAPPLPTSLDEPPAPRPPYP